MDSVVGSPDQKRLLGERWKAIAVDMESAGVAQAASEAGLPFTAVKSITDPVEHRLSIDFSRCRSEDKGYFFWAIAKQSLLTHHGIIDLCSLAWNARRAAIALATALLSSSNGNIGLEHTRSG